VKAEIFAVGSSMKCRNDKCNNYFIIIISNSNKKDVDDNEMVVITRFVGIGRFNKINTNGGVSFMYTRKNKMKDNCGMHRRDYLCRG